MRCSERLRRNAGRTGKRFILSGQRERILSSSQRDGGIDDQGSSFTVTFVLPAIFLLLLSPNGWTRDFACKVVGVLDGDTIEVLHNNRAERIRLNGIDCPEKGQAYGKKAKQAASELVFGKQVTLQTYGKDKYGRTIADVLLPDGTNVNHELVKDG